MGQQASKPSRARIEQLLDENRNEEAEQMCALLLEQQTLLKEGGANAPPSTRTALSLRTLLAKALARQGRFDTAMAEYRQIIDVQTSMFGEDNIHTLVTKCSLLNLLGEIGQVREALHGLAELLPVVDSCFPASELARTVRNNMALLHYQQGNLDEAEGLYRAIVAAEDSAGLADSANALATKNNLALVLNAQGHLDEAGKIFREVLLSETRLRSAHSFNACVAQRNLASLLADRGQLEPATRLLTDLLAFQTSSAGVESPAVLATQLALASVHRRAGRLDDGARLCANVVLLRMMLIGPQAPDTLEAKMELASVQALSGDYVSAERWLRDVIASRTSQLGHAHPLTIAAKRTLASMYAEPVLGRFQDAAGMFGECIALLAQTLGPDSPATLQARSSLASVIAAQGFDEEASRLFAQVLEAQTRLLGSENPERLATLVAFANAQYDSGRRSEASALLDEAGAGFLRLAPGGDANSARVAYFQAMHATESGAPASAVLALASTLNWQKANLPPGHSHLHMTNVVLATARLLLLLPPHAASEDPLAIDAGVAALTQAIEAAPRRALDELVSIEALLRRTMFVRLRPDALPHASLASAHTRLQRARACLTRGELELQTNAVHGVPVPGASERLGPLFRCRGRLRMSLAVRVLVEPQYVVTRDDAAFVRKVLAALGACEHAHVAPLLQTVVRPGDRVLVSREWFSHGTLARTVARGSGDWMLRVRLLCHAARGLGYLHSVARLVHGDVRAENVVLDATGAGRLAETGLASARAAVHARAAANVLRSRELAEVRRANADAVRMTGKPLPGSGPATTGDDLTFEPFLSANMGLLDADPQARWQAMRTGKREEDELVLCEWWGASACCAPGYEAPEQSLRPWLSSKADVYAFGVMVLCTLTALPALVPDDRPLSDLSFPIASWCASREGGIQALVDARVAWPSHVVQALIALAAECMAVTPHARPRLSDVAVRLDSLAAEQQ